MYLVVSVCLFVSLLQLTFEKLELNLSAEAESKREKNENLGFVLLIFRVLPMPPQS